MGNWTGTPELEDMIAEFPSKLKKAIYAAASKGTISRKTWDGCAFNAASLISQAEVTAAQSVDSASVAFNLTPTQVKNFILAWDNLNGTDEECTNHLKDQILKAGLFSEPGQNLPRWVRKRVFTGQATKDRIEFERMMVENAIEDIDVAELLFTVNPYELQDAS